MSTQTYTRTTSAEPCTILIVDDDELVVDSLERMFLEYEYNLQVEKTTDSREAIRLISEKDYDIVVTDLVMPEIDGIQVLRKVKELRPETEVIMITAFSSYNTALDAIHFGAFDYIPKPFNASEFKVRIRRAINKRKIIKEKNNKINEMERLCYTIAHDFKASILSIKSFTQILKKDYDRELNNDGRFLIKRVDVNVSIMESMIEGLLEYAKIGKLEKDWRAINTYELIKEEVENLTPGLKENKVQLMIHEPIPDIHFFPDGARRIFSNLIDNAIKYSREDIQSYIKIGVKNYNNPIDGKYYQFYIEDNGIGIAPENLNIIFEIFQRARNVTHERGYGVGLAIVKRILETSSCWIYAESTLKEKTVFYFTLPKAPE